MKELYAALAAFQADLPSIAKGETATVPTKSGGSYSYSYADLTDVSAVILPALAKHGLAFTARPMILIPEVGEHVVPEALSGRMVLSYALTHESGQSLRGVYPLPSNGTAQDLGGAITYARRYCLCAVTGVAPGGDDDDAKRAAASEQEERDVRMAERRAAAQQPQRVRQAHDQHRRGVTTDGEPRQTMDVPDRRQRRVPNEQTDGGARRGHRATEEESRQATAAQAEMITPDQVKLAQTLATKLGMNDGTDEARTMRLAYASTICGRRIESFSTMNKSEASRVIDSMQEDLATDEPPLDSEATARGANQ